MNNKIATSSIIKGKQMKTSHYFIPIRLAKVETMAVPSLHWNMGKRMLGDCSSGWEC